MARTHSRLVVTTAVVAFALLMTGCATAHAPVPKSSKTSSTKADVQAAPAPSPSPPPEIAPIASQTLTLQSGGGYIANVTVDWLPAVVVPLSSIPSLCVGWLKTTTGGDMSISTITEVPVRIHANYPNTNGFVWPASMPVLADFEIVDGSRQIPTCAPTLSEIDNFTLSAPPAGATDTIYTLLAAQRSPNNPTGAPGESLSTVMIQLAPGASVICANAGQGTDCKFTHP